jgi:hypothetical protein
VNLLDGPRFLRLMDRYFQLPDPISSDSAWPTADPSGFFERTLSQQIDPQRHDYYQQLGLALGLFRDLGPVQAQDVVYDVRGEVEREIGMSVEVFIRLGFSCSACCQAQSSGRPCRGTFTKSYLDTLSIQGQKITQPDTWSRFLLRVAADRDGFRQACANPLYQVRDVRYAQFEFNPLLRHPITHLGDGKYVAVDPFLVVERATFGLFYDLFERDGPSFTKRFGYVFDRFVGNLLESVCLGGSLWCDADPTRAKPKKAGKVADWAYQGEEFLVLFECKSLRPMLELVTYGSEQSLSTLRRRIADAVTQLTNHAASIAEGKWAVAGLQPVAKALGVIVTYGHINTAIVTFMRDRVNEVLRISGVQPIPFVVLSLEDLDQVVRLVELGVSLDQVIATLSEVAARGSADPLRQFTTTFEGKRPSSSFSFNRAEEFMEQMTVPKAQTQTIP